MIVGGESGAGPRPMDPQWVRDIRSQCLSAGVPFFFKQWGGVRKSVAGRELDGRTYDEMPERVRSPVAPGAERLAMIDRAEREAGVRRDDSDDMFGNGRPSGLPVLIPTRRPNPRSSRTRRPSAGRRDG